MDVVVLAGGRCKPDLRELSGVEERAMLEFRGRAFYEIVLEAVKPLGEPILVGGPQGAAPRQTQPGESFVASLGAGLALVKTDQFLLVTGDLPFLTTDSVNGFLTACSPGAQLYYPIVRADKPDERFGAMKRTTLKLREGVFTGGNIALADTATMRRILPTMERAYAARKKPLQLAGIVGMGVLGRVLVGKLFPAMLPLSALEQAVGRFLGATVKAVVTDHAEIGADVDNAAQYAAIQAL